MDDYENIFNGAGSAPAAAGGAAGLGLVGAAPKLFYDCSVPPD